MDDPFSKIRDPHDDIGLRYSFHLKLQRIHSLQSLIHFNKDFKEVSFSTLIISDSKKTYSKIWFAQLEPVFFFPKYSNQK